MALLLAPAVPVAGVSAREVAARALEVTVGNPQSLLSNHAVRYMTKYFGMVIHNAAPNDHMAPIIYFYLNIIMVHYFLVTLIVVTNFERTLIAKLRCGL